ncbi:MAG: signal peptide peptidase SppA [Methylococcales bacterium]|nr:signal peptide peptidase SppA [Methylococcales bacterium]
MDNSQDNVPKTDGWEREVLEKVALAAITEQTRARRWGVFFKALTFGYLAILMGVALYPNMKKGMGGDGKDHTAVVDIVGVIAEGKEVNAESTIKSLRAAVKDKNTKGIILHSNSPGGSPVQSAYIYEEIRNIKKLNPNLPIVAVVSDICASGCYYIASAADKIFVSPASLIGSIGVIMDGFGFVDTMKTLGVERRLITAGAHKAMLDPFSPPKPDENQYMQTLINQVHQQFITAVKQGRGDRLKETPDTFSGLVWTGEEGVKLGVADAFGSDSSVAKDLIGADRLVNFTESEEFFDKLAGKMGASFAHVINSALQTPALR